MQKSLQRLTGLFMVALLLGGCVSQSGFTERFTGPGADELLAQAENQSGQQAVQSRLQAADILARQGDDAQALEVATRIDAQLLEDADRVKWALLLSDVGLRQEDGWSVIQATQILESGLDTPPRDAQTLRYRRGLALNMVGEPQASLKTLIDLQRNAAPFDLSDDIWKVLSRFNSEQLASLELGDDPLAQGWIELALIHRRNGGDLSRLFHAIDEWRGRYPNHPAARRLPADLAALRDLRGKEITRVAVFLPESGPLANVASAIRNGIQARHMNALNQGEQTPQVTYYDTSQADLDSLYAQAMLDSAQVVIGPLDKTQVTELETRPEVPLPTLALNYGENPNNQAGQLYQYGLSAEDEARQIAARARMDGHHNAAVLVPDNDWGSRVQDAFRQAWEGQGGRVASTISYDPKASVASAVRPLLGVRGDRASRNDIDMLFLLALPSYARQVPPTLDFFYAGNLPIYATSHLYEGRPQPRVDHDLDGVLFVEIPWLIPDAAVGGEDALPFAATYRELQQGTEPGELKLNAMGVDAYELARHLPLFKTLPNMDVFGATGDLEARDDGRIQRTLPWAQFQNGMPQPVLIESQRLELDDATPR
ncbi:penicillin-binding protein activator [Halomonas shantousis]